MPQPLERFRYAGDKRVEIQLRNEQRIGSGSFANVYLVDLTVSVGKKSRRTAKFVLKRYKELGGRDQAESNAKQSVRHHELAKKAGLNVFNTYRFLEGEHSVVMTSGHTEDELCVGTNPGSNRVGQLPDSELKVIPEGTNMRSVIDRALDHAIQAAHKGIFLPQDALFFLVQKIPPHNIDFVIGDYDGVIESVSETKENLAQAYRSLEYFIDANFGEDKPAMLTYLGQAYHARQQGASDSK